RRWERQIGVGADRGDLDNQLVLQTIRLASEAQRWQGSPDDIDGFLHSLGLWEHGSITNAALLLYGKQPARVLSQARVRVTAMPEGKTGDRYSVDRLFEDCLLRTVQQIQEMLAVQLGGVETRFSGGWQRSENTLYPATALREGVMNALIHRDY